MFFVRLFDCFLHDWENILSLWTVSLFFIWKVYLQLFIMM
jgi:hypothetical protein